MTYLEASNPYSPACNIASTSTTDSFGTVATKLLTYDSLSKMHQMTDVAEGTLYTAYSARNPAAGDTMDVFLKIYGAGGPAPDIWPPHITATAPTEGATNVPVTTKIDVTWNESMNQGSAQSAFSSAPAITCGWAWAGNVQTCTPTANLQGTTPYKITISSTAKDAAGNAMKNPYTLNFTTGGGGTNPNPNVTATDPLDQATNVALNKNIAITFSLAMDKTVSQTAVSANPSITWTPAWSSGDTIVTFTPSANMQASKLYTITVSTNAKSAAGKPLFAAKTFSFTTGTGTGPTPPTVSGTDPIDGAKDVALNAPITITFDKAMDKTATEGAITASPSITWTKAWSGDTIITLTPSANLAS